MQPQREAMTDCLADIIHVLHIGRKSGTLTVERGDDRKVEEGSIKFVDGRVVDARVNQLRGLPAFNYLNVWQRCYFSFVNAPPPASLNTPSPPPYYSGHTDSIATTDAFYFNQMPEYRGNSGALPDDVRNTTQPTLPMRSYAGEELLQRPGDAQLPRIHRRLLLLVNGQRSISELARLMTRTPNELQILLDDLERAGLIQQ